MALVVISHDFRHIFPRRLFLRKKQSDKRSTKEIGRPQLASILITHLVSRTLTRLLNQLDCHELSISDLQSFVSRIDQGPGGSAAPTKRRRRIPPKPVADVDSLAAAGTKAGDDKETRHRGHRKHKNGKDEEQEKEQDAEAVLRLDEELSLRQRIKSIAANSLPALEHVRIENNHFFSTFIART